MSKAGRVLRFPGRRRATLLSAEEAESKAQAYLGSSGPGDGQLSKGANPQWGEASLANPDVLWAICRALREGTNTSPTFVAEKATSVYRFLAESGNRCGLFDEHEFFVGEMALLAAGAFRLMGQREEADCWIDRAEAAYRHTVNPAPSLAQVSYQRLSLRYDKRQFREVLELIPSTLKSFEVLGMRSELGKGQFLQAMALKESALSEQAFERFSALKRSLSEDTDAGLMGQVFVETGAYQYAAGRHEEGSNDFRSALRLLTKAGRSIAVAHLQVSFAEMLRNNGKLLPAADAYQEGAKTYSQVGMSTYSAYARVLAAETLLAASRPREAEWEILQALPTIEEQKMVPEGFAAVALLRESVKQRKADPNALRELREHLQKQN